MIICIDFDNTIHDMDHPLPGRRMGGPLPNAKAALTHLMKYGHTVIILSARAATPKGIDTIRDFMTYYGLPYDTITNNKPSASYYVDDKGIRFTDWTSIMAFIQADQKQK